MAQAAVAMQAVAENADPQEKWVAVEGLVCALSADIPVPDFTVGRLLQLGPGSIVNTYWDKGRDVPVLVNGVQIGWSSIEAPGQLLALRLTDLL